MGADRSPALIQEHDAFARLRPCRPGARLPEVAVRHEVDVHFARVGAERPHRVAAHDRAGRCRGVQQELHVTGHAELFGDRREVRVAGRTGQEQPEPLVITVVGQPGQVISGDGDPHHVRGDPLGPENLRPVETAFTPRVLEGHAHSLSK